jgi:hypothetical protein
MKTITTTLYGYDELSDVAKDVAYKNWLSKIESGDYDPTEFVLQDIMDSLHGLAKIITGYTGYDWSVGMHNQNYKYTLKKDPIVFENSEEVNFYARTSRARARRIGWWENNVLSPLRITRKQYKEGGYHLYGKDYQIGKVKPCPFTGVFFDEVLLEEAYKYFVVNGTTIEHTFDLLARDIDFMLREEYEYQTSREHFEDYHAYEDGECYLEDGSKYEN